MDAVFEILGEIIAAVIMGESKVSTFFRVVVILFILFAIGFSIYKLFS